MKIGSLFGVWFLLRARRRLAGMPGEEPSA
jgi:hypothetical protein